MSYSQQDHRPVLNVTEARQGRWGRHVFWVLLFSTLLAAIGLFAAWAWKAGDFAATEPTPAAKAAAARSFDAPTPPPPTPPQASGPSSS